MIFDRSLSSEEIQNIYGEQKPGTSPARISQTDDLTDKKLNNLVPVLSSIQLEVQDILKRIQELF